MPRLRALVEGHPYVFAVGLFVVESGIALPFVVAFNLLGLELEPLRLAIPVAQSALMIGVVWALGWFSVSGFEGPVRNVRLYAYPTILAFMPVLAHGTIELDAGAVAFYALALVFTGISEETLARGVILPALLPRGKWVALFLAAALFSVGHLSNLFFEEFGILEWSEKLLSTFSFAILYGAVFLRTGSIWPLIVLHAVHDFSFLTSGTAGPYTVEPMAIELSLALGATSVVYGVVLMAGMPDEGLRPERAGGVD